MKTRIAKFINWQDIMKCRNLIVVITKALIILNIILILISCEEEITSPYNPYNEHSRFTDRNNWCFASKPCNFDLPTGKINYFMPGDFLAMDVYDDSLLTEQNESQMVSLLRNKLTVCPVSNPGYEVNCWSGLIQYLEEPINLTEIDYIECQILENADIFPDVPVTLHIDIGLICEDFFRPGVNPDPDSEDGIVEYNGELDDGEDIGLDRIATGELGDLPDDDCDNLRIYVNGYEEYPEINGAEGNYRLDTEDLNGDGLLNLTNSYIHYSFSLDSSEYLTSINNKGLRTYRIPIGLYNVIMDSNIEPDILNLEYIRLWFEYPEDTYVILIALDFVDLENLENTRRIIKSTYNLK